MLKINYVEKPELDRPAMIMGFSGWPNAGEVSTGALSYLKSRLKARSLAHIEPTPFFDFTDTRPTASIKGGRVEDLVLPKLNFYYVTNSEIDGDLILFSGLEPQYNWQGFCFLIFEVVRHMGVEAIYTLGGTYDYVPHWIPPRISLTWSDEKALKLFQGVKGLEMAEYEGPVSIHTLLLTESRDKGIPVAGLWGHAPVYIQTGNLKIHRAMVKILEKAIGFSLDTQDLVEGIKRMDIQLDEMAEDNEQFKKYLDNLKNEYRGPQSPSKTGSRSNHNDKVISLTDFMKRDKD